MLVTKKAKDVKKGDHFFKQNGDHIGTEVLNVEPLGNGDWYTNLTYVDRWGNVIVCPHENNQTVYLYGGDKEATIRGANG